MPAVPDLQAAVAGPGLAVAVPPSGFVKFAKDSFAGTMGERVCRRAGRLRASAVGLLPGSGLHPSLPPPPPPPTLWASRRPSPAGGIAVTMVGHPFGECSMPLLCSCACARQQRHRGGGARADACGTSACPPLSTTPRRTPPCPCLSFLPPPSCRHGQGAAADAAERQPHLLGRHRLRAQDAAVGGRGRPLQGRHVAAGRPGACGGKKAGWGQASGASRRGGSVRPPPALQRVP